MEQFPGNNPPGISVLCLTERVQKTPIAVMELSDRNLPDTQAMIAVHCFFFYRSIGGLGEFRKRKKVQYNGHLD
ncbi:MAG: hypothetical protein JRG69_02225 [Deltaproteobacteria bacterium]|nr:hypothetical protein [Deltaproteobacteria bacterium]